MLRLKQCAQLLGSNEGQVLEPLRLPYKPLYYNLLLGIKTLGKQLKVLKEL